MPSCCCLGARPNLQPSTLEVENDDHDEGDDGDRGDDDDDNLMSIVKARSWTSIEVLLQSSYGTALFRAFLQVCHLFVNIELSL